MFAFKDRVHHEQFETILKQGKRIQGSLVYMQFLKNDLDRSRFSAVAPKSIAKKAFQRNRLKRYLREAVRIHRDKLPKGFDYVVFAKKGSLDVSSADLAQDIGNLIEKI